MTDNAKKFLKFASENKAVKNAINDAKDTEAMLKLAASHGFKLTAEDFAQSEMEELSEDEMKAVSGGSLCLCGNTGSGSAHNLDCICTGEGDGYDPEGGRGGCACFAQIGLGAGWN
ncbi:MAG: Nif11-like leader peptide family RiPP precursor [Synergistaceae bacterium]|nr:Nif11-like leader peptide family RiPP precursor [Synergistaceae bacterium]